MPLAKVFSNISSAVANRQRFDPTLIRRAVEQGVDSSINLSKNIGSAAGYSLGAPIRVGTAAASGVLSGVKNQFPVMSKNNSKQSTGILDQVGVGGTINFGKDQPVPMAVYILGGVALVAIGFGVFSRLNQPKRKRR